MNLVAPYFAFGSNMDADRLQDRVGHIDRTAVRSARLEGFRLCFDKRSRTAGGAATVLPAPGCTVQGVLYDLTDAQLEQLDAIEFHPVHYLRTLTSVVVDGGERSAWMYVGQPEFLVEGLRPTPEYLACLLRGAEWLPPAYVAYLEDLTGDADRVRSPDPRPEPTL